MYIFPTGVSDFRDLRTPRPDLEKTALLGLRQIKEKHYQAELEARGVRRGIHIGLAFCGKHINLQSEAVDYIPKAPFLLP